VDGVILINKVEVLYGEIIYDVGVFISTSKSDVFFLSSFSIVQNKADMIICVVVYCS